MLTTKRIQLALCLGLVTTGWSLTSVAESEVALAESWQQAITGGKANISFRYRYEQVEQSGNLDRAHASTLKTRLNYKTLSYKKVSAFVEVDDVTVIGNENHFDFRNSQTDHSVVTDPEGTEINQAWLAYSGFEATRLRYGRQRLNFDNQRFIGGVGWRQNEQTFDSLSLVNTTYADTELSYVYVHGVNRIFGPDDGSPAADLDTNGHFLHLHNANQPIGKLSVYGYWMDFDNAPGLSSGTLGVRLSGERKTEQTNLLYTAEVARQSDVADNPNSYDAFYYALEVGLKASPVVAKLGLEVLEGDRDRAGESFQTPLATLHAFQGWSDQFLTTPNDGLEDLYLSIATEIEGFKLAAIYHDFEAQDGSRDFGDEVNLSIGKKVHKNVGVLLKYAEYDAGDSSTGKVDTEKLWLQITVTF